MSDSKNDQFPLNFFFDNNLVDNEQFSVAEKKEIPSEETAPVSDEFSLEELNMIRDAINDFLKSVIPEQKFNTYFADNYQLETINNGIATFTVPTSFLKKTISTQFTDMIKEGFVSVLGKPFEIIISVKNTGKDFSTQKSNEVLPSKPVTPYNLDLDKTVQDIENKIESETLAYINNVATTDTIDPKKKFDNFIEGSSNGIALAMAKAVAGNPGKNGKYPSIYFYSNSGLGKTHLLHAIGNEIKNNYPEKVICLTTAQKFKDEMVEHIRRPDLRLEDFQRKYSESIDVLMIDDIHGLKKQTRTQEEFFNIFNNLYQNKKQLIFTSDKDPSDIEGVEDRIITRLKMSAPVEILPPDLETRIAILKIKAAEFDMYINDEVINLIARSIKNNIRELEGALLRLSAFVDHMNIDIDVEIAKEYLKLNPTNIDNTEISLEDIIKITAKHFEVEVADIKSTSRKKEISIPRQISMYLCKKIANATYEEIAEALKKKDHSTIIHGVKKISNELKKDYTLKKTIQEIESKIDA